MHEDRAKRGGRERRARVSDTSFEAVTGSQPNVSAALESLRIATGEDTTAAVCAVQDVRRAFSMDIEKLAMRTGRLEAGLAEVEQATPLLLPFDEPLQTGRGVKALWVKIFWAVLAVLCVSAMAGGFLAGRWWSR
jgi:hypothetical protein